MSAISLRGLAYLECFLHQHCLIVRYNSYLTPLFLFFRQCGIQLTSHFCYVILRSVNFQSTRAKQVQQGGCSHTITSDLLLALVTPSEPKVPHLSLRKQRSVPYTQQRFRSFKPVSYQKTKTPAEYPDYFGNLFTLEIYKNFSPKI